MRKYDVLYDAGESKNAVIFRDEGDEGWCVYSWVATREAALEISEALNLLEEKNLRS